jgi:ABC-type uncharacterized transport system involved in gliding motility auxiliary subunit
MTGRRYAFIVSAALFVLFVCANIVANSWLRGARLDLTANQVYSLSRGARGVLRDLDEPLQLTFFYSRDAAARYPMVQAYAGRVRELLAAFAAHARGRLRIVEVDPKAFTDAEDEASAAGVEPAPVEQGADPIYFGLAGANAVDDRRAIPFFSPDREAFLEYEITRLIYELENPETPKVGLISSLPIDPAGPNPMSQGRGGMSVLAAELGRFMRVEKLAPNFAEIPSDIDVLAILHPGPLQPAQLYAIDQFILTKGRAFIALDPGSIASLAGGFDPLTGGPSAIPPASNLAPILAPWGVSMSPEIVLDLIGAIPVRAPDDRGQLQVVPQPVLLFVEADRLDREDLTTAWLQRGVTFGLAGALSVSDRPGVTATTLARTTAETMRLPAAEAMARPDPRDLLRGWVSANRSEILAVRLSGSVQSAFPSGPPAGARAPARPLRRSARPAQIVVVADSDFLSDDLYVSPQGTFADNGAFALNALDVLAGSDAMVSLRSRAPSFRRMTLLDRMEAEAQQRIQQRQAQLQSDLRATQARLQDLQSRGQGARFFAGDLGAELSRAQRAELDRFRARLVEVRQQLRAVGRDLRRGVDLLQGWTIFLNVWLVPLLVAAAGLYVFWRRRRRSEAHA